MRICPEYRHGKTRAEQDRFRDYYNPKTATNGAEIWAACEVHNQTRGDSVMPLSTLLPLILLALIGIAAFYALYRAGV